MGETMTDETKLFTNAEPWTDDPWQSIENATASIEGWEAGAIFAEVERLHDGCAAWGVYLPRRRLWAVAGDIAREAQRIKDQQKPLYRWEP